MPGLQACPEKLRDVWGLPIFNRGCLVNMVFSWALKSLYGNPLANKCIRYSYMDALGIGKGR